MPKPRRLSGIEVIHIFEQFGFIVEGQRGSHMKLSRIEGGERQVLIVSNHKELKTGSVIGIFRQASRYIPESELRKHFYSL
ncbi:MAG: type II toxin-antitoxin system HicA family toxin [Candidatus Kaiserbacteria bacterium]|nr:type II toxin-antitoxin system HicA family toxin [Candidatus Kaiserbacteria bacterium]